jgi:hypothetical protein
VRGGGKLDAKGNVVALGIDFAKAKADGYRFCWVKSRRRRLEGPVLSRQRQGRQGNWTEGRGLPLRPKPRKDRTGAQEASFFIARLKEVALGGNDLRPAADSEEMKSGLSRTAILDYEFDFLSALDRAKLRPVNYTFPSYLAPPGHDLGDWGPRFKRWPLWLADYSGKLDIPQPWTEVVAHQHTSKGMVAGIKGEVDLNETDDLRRLIA